MFLYADYFKIAESGGEFLKYINDITANRGVYKNLKNSKGQTLDQLLKQQARYLQELINIQIREYRKVFKPKTYKRTGNLENSVSVSDVKYVNGIPTVYVYFNENAVHRSGFGVWAVKDGRGKYDDDNHNFDSDDTVNTAILINEGYSVKKPVWFAGYENFGFRAGKGFVDKAIAEFNRINSLGITVTWDDYIQGHTRIW